uniref:glutaredoxin n=1 Tax=Erythrolobus coxiae TaxID=362235 RepID=UPI001FCE00A3|nr:glutaredoxin [Erythrolobus coxiae]UNJ17625.1 glutaredoxin [Erythrolobus coxiae]
MTNNINQKINDILESDTIVLFMKGSQLMPMCGFSNTAIQILNNVGAKYQTINVLENYDIREGIKSYSNWPTIPQLYVDKEFIGGSDIMLELYETGQLQELIERAVAS